MPAFPLKGAAMAVLVALTISGCSFAPTYQRPDAPLPAAWPKGQPDAPAAAAAGVPLGLADLVVDAALLNLVGTAVDNNRNLRQALLNVEAARAQYGVQRAELFPTVGAQAGGTRQRTPANLSQTGATATAATAATAAVHQAGVGITSFELDLFGRVRNLSESALQEFLAVEQNAQAARISLAAEVMQAYILRQSAQARLQVTQRTLAARTASLELTEHRRSAGAGSAVELEDARSLEAQARADLEQVRRELRQADNALRLLAGTVDLPDLPDMPEPPSRQGALFALFALRDLGAGAPSDLLWSRPDILAAENALRARHADIGAARAAFFPRLSLTAFLGTSSAQLSDLFRGGQRSWSFAPQLTVPLFDAGRNQANLDLAVIRRDSAVAQYEGAVQTALREVADALAANDTLRNEVEHRKALLDSSRRSLGLAQARHRGGLDSSLRYLDAQRSAYASEMEFIQIVAQRQTAIVSLFKALGGRWYLG